MRSDLVPPPVVIQGTSPYGTSRTRKNLDPGPRVTDAEAFVEKAVSGSPTLVHEPLTKLLENSAW